MHAPRWLPAVALLLGVVVFLPMFGHPFFRDDFGWVERTIQALPHPARWFATAKTDFRPLASFSFVMNYAASRLDPRGYHLFDLLLHLANVSLLYALVRRLSGSAWAAGVAALLCACAFGNYGEAVYWISGRTGLIGDLFVLATLAAHWDELERGGSHAPSLLLFTLALLGKETSVVLLPLLGLLEWAHPARFRARRLVPFLFVLVGYLAFTFLVWRRGSGVVGHDWAVGPHVARNLLESLVRMFVPVTADSWTVRVPGALAPVLARVFRWGGIALAALGAWIVLFTRAPRTWKFALLWIPLAILPVTFLTLRTSPRYLYLPSLGLAAFLAMAWARAWERSHRRHVALAAALLAVLALQVGVMEIVLAKRGALARSEAAGPAARLQAVERAHRVERVAFPPTKKLPGEPKPPGDR